MVRRHFAWWQVTQYTQEASGPLAGPASTVF